MACSLVAMVVGAGVVHGQAYPYKTIRIVASGVGGGSDFTARLIAQGISGPLGQPVIVDNRANAIVQGETVSKSQPDGYTLLLGGSAIWLAPFLQDKVPWEPLRDFATVTQVERSPNMLVVHPSVPANSVKELIALAKAKPGALNFASGGAGGSAHLAGELFKAMAAINIVWVPYKSGSQAILALMGGETQMTFAGAESVIPHIKSGKVRALAVTSAQPSALVPGMPTVAATGLPGYEMTGMTGVFAPAQTPAPVINRLNQEILLVLNRPEVKEKFLTLGVEIIPSSPAQFAAAIKADMDRLGKLIKDAGIKTN